MAVISRPHASRLCQCACVSHNDLHQEYRWYASNTLQVPPQKLNGNVNGCNMNGI